MAGGNELKPFGTIFALGVHVFDVVENASHV